MKQSPSKSISLFTVLATFCFVALTALPVSVQAESKLDFKLINDTGYEINSVFIAPNKSDDWGDDILGKGVRLADGESTDITFHRRSEHEGTWDLKVLFNDGEYRFWRNFDLSTISEITIHYKKDHATATWK
jgi:hypothetical protein